MTFMDNWAVEDPMLAVWRKALAKRREGPPRPEMPVEVGMMIPVVCVNPVEKVFWK